MRKLLLLLPAFLFLFCCGCYYVRSDQKVIITDMRDRPYAVWGRKPIAPGTMVFKAMVEVYDDDCAFTGFDDIAALLFLETEFLHEETSHVSHLYVLDAYGGTGSGIAAKEAFVKGMLSLRGRKDGMSLTGIWRITVPSAHEGIEPKTWEMRRTYIITTEAVYVEKGAVDPPTGHGISESGRWSGEAELAPDPHHLENVMCGWYSDDGEFHRLPVKDISELPADEKARASEGN